MAVKKRALLDSLSKSALAEFARGMEVPGFSTMSKPELVDVLAGMRSLPVAEVLGQMSRDELKAACEAEGLDTSGREKAVLIERLIGRAEKDMNGDADGKNWLKSEPAPDPRLGFGEKKKESKRRSSEPAGEARPRGSKRAIEQYEHKGAERLNNPPVGLVTPESDPIEAAPGAPGKTQYQYDPHLDPTLQWAGKAERMSFEVPTVSLHVHERIDPKTILEAVKTKNGSHADQMGLFGSPRENPPLREAIDFYKHPHGWSNRLIAGDSLLVMNSLLEKEGMAGKVQMVYFDPPYGITYKSNFMPFVNEREVKDRNDAHLTREPEQLKAFRDTWELGIHSYLTYLRDRLQLAHRLLDDRGSLFVQIGEENLHRVRCLCDEVFGPENALVTIVIQKKGSTSVLHSVNDYVIWFAKDKKSIRPNQLYRKRDTPDDDPRYNTLISPSGEHKRRKALADGEEERLRDAKWRWARVNYPLVSQHPSDTRSKPFKFNGKTFVCGKERQWSFDPETELRRLGWAHRLFDGGGESLGGVVYWSDWPYVTRSNLWDDLHGEQDIIYVVQTNRKIVERCMLMTSAPGDLVLDITCGSGTTAYIAEQLGRRWITCDTSRVAITLAKQRLMTADFDYYKLKHPEQGIAGGFDYETIGRITPASIAKNAEITEGMSRDAIERAIRRTADPVTLFDQPKPDPTRTRVAGPFTVEAVPAPVIVPVSQVGQDEGGTKDGSAEADSSIARRGETLRQSQWRAELLRTGARGEGGLVLGFTRVEPMGGTRFLHASGMIREDGGFRHKTWKAGDSVAICFGPEHAPLEQRVVQRAWEEARDLTPRPAALLFAAFQFDPEAQKDIDEMDPAKAGMLFLRAGMNDDLTTEDLKKKRSSNESFWLIGQPDVVLRRAKAVTGGADTYTLEVQGFDYFDAKTGSIESGGTDRIAMWMLDTDYDGRSVFPRQVFFPMAGAKEGWSRLAASLRAEIDPEKIEAYRGVKSLPFAGGKFGRIAVKIVDDRGIESLVIRSLDEAEGAAAPKGAKGNSR